MFVTNIDRTKTTTVALGPHFDAFIRDSVLGGRYTNASEVIRAGDNRIVGCHVFSLAIEQIYFVKVMLIIDVFKRPHEKGDQK